jgi:hypothetical protein
MEVISGKLLNFPIIYGTNYEIREINNYFISTTFPNSWSKELSKHFFFSLNENRLIVFL